MAQIATAEEGVLLARSGGAWRALPPPMKNATILFIDQAPSGEYFALVEERSTFAVFSTADPTAGWTELRRFPVQRFLNPAHNSHAEAAMAAGRIAVLHSPGGLAGITLHTFDVATRQWEATAFEYDRPVNFLSDGAITATSGTALNRALRVSRDWGRTWVRKPLESWAILPTFKDARAIYVWKFDKAILKSQDGGETWQQTGELPQYVNEIWALPRSGWLMITTNVGQTQVSSDDGKTWTLQYVSP